MPVAGIICEYNPFHLGHARMIENLRRQGMDGIVCAMSGNFVQRGEFALLSKQARAEMAVRCGADLVLEVPTPWSASGAENFARGGAALLEETGVVTHLAFGSECGDVSALDHLAEILDSREYESALQRNLRSGRSFAVCRRMAAAELLGEETAALLDLPNNNLGVEYCRALHRMHSRMKVITLPREGAEHDSAPCDGIASASCIRKLLRRGNAAEAVQYLPRESAEILLREMAAGRAPVYMEQCERAVLARLRCMNEADFAPYDGGGEGLYRRVYRAVQEECTVRGILDAAKTKRYSHARLRRLLLAAYLELPTDPLPERLPYLRLLAANERGRQLLREMRDQHAPVLTKPADVASLGREAEKLFTEEARRTDLYTLAYPNLQESRCGADWRAVPILL